MQPKKQLKVQYIGIFEEIDSFYVDTFRRFLDALASLDFKLSVTQWLTFFYS